MTAKRPNAIATQIPIIKLPLASLRKEVNYEEINPLFLH